MILYDYPKAPNPMRVNLFINEKKIEIERKIVDLSCLLYTSPSPRD